MCTGGPEPHEGPLGRLVVTFMVVRVPYHLGGGPHTIERTGGYLSG